MMENGVIEGYILQYTLPEQLPENTTETTETMYILGGLTPFTTYTVVIVALTDKGAGPPSEELTVYTLEDRKFVTYINKKCRWYIQQPVQHYYFCYVYSL